MQRKNFFILLRYIIYYNQFNFANTLVGQNITQAAENELKNVVSILEISNRPTVLRFNIKCTGTLITRNHVLSAEHCFTNMGTRGLYIRAGSIDLRQATPFYITWWITYEQWANLENIELEYMFNDIAVIKLISSVPETIHPALLSPDQNNNLYGLRVTLAGWGKLPDGIQPNILHKVNVTIISNRDCETLAFRILQGYLQIPYRYLCTIADPYALVNHGDSGGPMFYGHFLIGINQGTCPRTNNIIDPRKANLHCTVDFYRQFIERNMLL